MKPLFFFGLFMLIADMLPLSPLERPELDGDPV
jgi:hypothetical protein